MDDETLIREHVEENPRRPGPADARLVESGVELWALLNYLQRARGGDVVQTALDYEIPESAVRAALAYYRRHRDSLDARIAVSAA